jgi:hypothetical protein
MIRAWALGDTLRMDFFFQKIQIPFNHQS